MDIVAQGYKGITSNGFAVFENLCPSSLITPLKQLCETTLDQILNSLGDKEIGIGSAAGYQEVCQRSPGRWDVPIKLAEFGIDYQKTNWWPIITKVLGEDAIPCFQGLITSAPHTPAQHWHIDAPHLSKEHLPPNVINVLVALEDISLDMGPTELALGTHRYTNHLVNPDLVIDELVYQCEKTNPQTLMNQNITDEFKTWNKALSTGSVIMFDDRILHRGQANKSNKYRHVAYFSYAREGYDQNTYFESNRSLDS